MNFFRVYILFPRVYIIFFCVYSTYLLFEAIRSSRKVYGIDLRLIPSVPLQTGQSFMTSPPPDEEDVCFINPLRLYLSIFKIAP